MVRIFSSLTRGRRLRIGTALAACTALVMLMAVPAFAVHDLEFQLDGNTRDDAASTQDFDWANFINSAGALISPRPAGFDASGFDRDFNTNTNGSFSTSDSTTFATGSKDTLPITPGWQCNTDNNVLSKSDVMNAYAASYVDPATNDEIMYFALERNANTGTGNVGFWFLQDGTVNCESGGGSTAFTGAHANGDVLVVSEFTQGGSVSTINAYAWEGGPNGTLNPDSIADGAACSTSSGDDDICAQVNSGTLNDIPWLTANKQDGVGHSLRVSEFFEGGINLTDSGLGGKCFNVFIGDTRSSTSLTATIFDFSRGSIGGCTSTTTTTPVDNAGVAIPAGGLDIPADPADAAILVKDRAVVDVGGADTFTATLSFNLCGPFAAGSSTLCTTGGVPVQTQNITADGTYTSSAATVTQAGRYCWRAVFSGDATVGVPGSDDSRASECFTVNPRQSVLATQAGTTPVDLGQPVTDTATLTNTAHKPGTGGPAGSTNGSINPTTLGGDATGSITFTLFKADCTTLATGTGTNPQSVNVTGNGSYGPVSFTPDAPGTYHWVASYTGDLPNTLGDTHNTDCLDTNERVVVNQAPTSIATRQFVFPQDKATITTTPAGLTLSGNVSFKLYDTLANCTANGATGLLYSQGPISISGVAPQSATTNNTTVRITTDTTVYWRVTYTSNTPAQLGSSSVCSENTAVTYAGNDGTISIP